MSKKLRLIALTCVLAIVSVFAAVRASTPDDSLGLSAEGCQNVAQAIGYGALKQSEGEPSPWIELKEPEKYPEVFQNHIRLLNQVLRQFPQVDPHTHYEDYLNFCYEAKGYLTEMNRLLKKLVKETDA